MARYADPAITDSPLADLHYKFNNRKTMTRQLLSNSPIKRFLCLRQFKAIEKKFLPAIITCGPTDTQPILP